MLKSMTAYGRASETVTAGSLSVEIHSVNRKHLDIKVYCPAELRRFEIDIQKQVSQAASRGQITVKIMASYERSSPVSVTPNLELARQIKRAADDISRDLGIEDPQFSMRLVGENRDILNFAEGISDEQLWKGELAGAIDRALAPYLKMKEFEGKKLHEDLALRIDKMEGWILSIEQLSERSTDAMRKKLIEALESALNKKVDNEESLLREVCLYAEKVDVSEEITRFQAHLEHFKATMQSDGPVGKTLDFIGQELFREVNTIASKAADTDISHLTIKIKTELERIREQLQNVE